MLNRCFPQNIFFISGQTPDRSVELDKAKNCVKKFFLRMINNVKTSREGGGKLAMYDKHKSDDCHFNVVKCLNKKIYVEFWNFPYFFNMQKLPQWIEPCNQFSSFLSTFYPPFLFTHHYFPTIATA